MKQRLKKVDNSGRLARPWYLERSTPFPYDDFNALLHQFAPPSLINIETKSPYIVSSTPSPHRQTISPSYSLAPKHLLNCTLFKSLITNQAHLIEPYNQEIKVQATTKDIKREDRCCTKSPPQEA